MIKYKVYCDMCKRYLEFDPYQRIDLGMSKSRELCLNCYTLMKPKLDAIDEEIRNGGIKDERT